jgi:PAS domain-containing protein
LLNFRRSIGFGALLKGLTENYGIIYAILQDTSGIIAASGELFNPTNLAEDKFLYEALKISKFSTRVIENDSLEIFEAVHPFKYKNEIIGLLRLGLPADPLLSVNKSNTIRVISLSLILLLLGSSILAYTFKKQNYELLKKDYKDIESYSHLVIENVSDAVIVLDENRSLLSINKAAENLFQINSKNIINRDVDSYLSTEITDFIQSEDIDILNITTRIRESKKHLLASKNTFYTSKNELNTILVLSSFVDRQ